MWSQKISLWLVKHSRLHSNQWQICLTLGPELSPYFIQFLKCQIHTISIMLYNTVIQVLNHSLKAHSTYIWYPSKTASLSLSISIEHVTFKSIKQFPITYVICALSSFMLDGYNLQPQSTEALSFGKDSKSCLIDSNTRS